MLQATQFSRNDVYSTDLLSSVLHPFLHSRGDGVATGLPVNAVSHLHQTLRSKKEGVGTIVPPLTLPTGL